jgi:hypothetical protein
MADFRCPKVDWRSPSTPLCFLAVNRGQSRYKKLRKARIWISSKKSRTSSGSLLERRILVEHAFENFVSRRLPAERETWFTFVAVRLAVCSTLAKRATLSTEGAPNTGANERTKTSTCKTACTKIGLKSAATSLNETTRMPSGWPRWRSQGPKPRRDTARNASRCGSKSWNLSSTFDTCHSRIADQQAEVEPTLPPQ